MKGYIAFINMSTKVDAIMKTPKTQIVLISTCSVLNAIASSASSGNKSNGMLNKAATISFGMKSLGSGKVIEQTYKSGESVDIVPTIANILGFDTDIPAGLLDGKVLSDVFV